VKVAVIPARGGSKRIPHKNIRPFCGRPMIAHSIAAALDSGLFDRVIVSTEDAQIAGVARACGAELPFTRPTELADDHASTLAVMRHAVGACESLGWKVDLFCCLYATAPFVLGSDLEQGLRALADPRVQYAFSAASFGFPVQRAIRLRGDGSVEPVWPEAIPMRSQDLEPLYHDAGQFYCGRSAAFAGELPLFAPHSRAVVLPAERVQDIDTLEDWARAELMYQAWRQSSVVHG
jgi:pseudaminic acid cytidylyltransferase